MSHTGHLSELDVLRSQVADLSRQLAERDRSAHHQRERSDLLRAIVDGTAAETGEEFFSALVTHLTSVLHIQYALIGEVQGDHIKKIRTLAVSAGGVLVDNFDYELADTPCATALTQTFACFDRNVQATFPQFQRLVDLGAESYCAVPIRTKDGAVIGLLVVMDTKPLEHTDALQSLLEVFAPRIAAEFERKRAEQERAQALADLHNVIETIPDIVFALDTQGNVVKWNRRLEDVTGYSPEELLNRPALAFVPPEEQTLTAAAIQRVFVEGYAELESHLLTKERHLIPYHWTGALLKNTHGEPIGITGIGRDVSDKKRAEEALRKSEERYARATAVGKVGVWELDVATGTYHGDPNLKALFGYADDELSTDPYAWLNLVHPDNQSIAMDHWQRIVNGERDNYNYEARMLKKDGTVIWTEVRGHAVRDHEGQVTHLFGATVDISERKQAQDALVQSEHQLRTVLDALPVGVWFTDQSGKVLLANPAARQIWSGIKQVGIEKSAHGAGWWETIGPTSAFHRWALGQALTRGVASLNETLNLECLDGTKKTVRNSTVPVQGEDGVILGAIVLNEDLSPLRQAQEALALTQFSVDHAVEGFFWIDPDAMILSVNEAACRMLEYTRDELTTMTVHDIDPSLPPDLWPIHWEDVKRKGSVTFESKYWSRTGLVMDTEITFNYLLHDGAEYNCAIVRDITQRKRDEDLLRESEQAIRALHEAAATPGLSFDERIQAVLEVGCRRFKLSIGVLTRVVGEVLEFTHIWAPGTNFTAGMAVPLSTTYCQTTLQSTGPVCVEHAGQSDWRNHPGYKALGLECYLGTKLLELDHVQGTVCFLGEDPHTPPFSQADKNFLQLMARWITGELERREAEQALKESEQAIRALYEATATPGLSFDERIQAILEVGCRRFKLSIGVLTRVVGEELEFTHIHAPGTSFTTGMAVPLSTTYCQTTLQSTSPVYIEHAGNSDWRTHPGYKTLGLECYIGTKLFGLAHMNGTICFLGQDPYHDVFSQADKDFLQLMARWITGELDRVAAERALVTSEERYHALYDDTPTMYFTLATDGTVLSVNRFGAEQLGYQVEELTGHSVLGLFHEEDKEAVAASLSECLATPEMTRHWEFRKIRKDGTVIWVQETARVIQSSTGGTVVLVTCEDITERKQAEEALRLSEERFRAVFENAAVGIAVGSHTTGTGIDQVNPVFAGMLGYTPEELYHIGMKGLTFPDDIPASKELVKQLVEGTRSHGTIEKRYIKKDGSLMWAQTTVSSIFDSHGRYLSSIALIQDITERKRVDEALRASEERYRDLYNETPTMYFTLAVDGTVRSVNRFGAEQLGYRVEELMGCSVLSLFHEGDKEAVVSSLSECLPNPEETRHWAFRKVRKDGSTVWVRETARVGQSPSGETVVLVTCEDITERRQVEDALKKTEQYNRILFENSPIGLVLCQLDGTIADCNERYGDILGRNRSDILGKTYWELTPEKYRDRARLIVETLCHTGRFGPYEKEYIHAAGHLVPVRLFGSLIDKDGELCMVCSVEDITERKRVEQEQVRLIEELTRSQQHFQSLFNWTPSAVGISTVAEGRFIDVNEGFHRLTGYTREEVIGHTTLELGLWADLSERESVLRKIQEEGYLHNREGLLRTKSGEVRSLMVSVESIQLGSTLCLIYLCHDITDRKRMEDALRTREHELHAALQERERISQDLHDGILQSLFAVGLNLEVSKSRMSPSARKTFGASLDQAIEQLNRVMREIRNFIAGLDSDLLEGKDLPAALQSMLTLLTENQPTRVRLAVEKRAVQAVSAEQSFHLFRVIQEAVSNCIRHGGAQEARVSLKMLKQGVRLSIRDNGRGFNQGTVNAGGYGLRNMADRAQKINGRFTVLSKENEGTRIILDLPKEVPHFPR